MRGSHENMLLDIAQKREVRNTAFNEIILSVQAMMVKQQKKLTARKLAELLAVHVQYGLRIPFLIKAFDQGGSRIIILTIQLLMHQEQVQSPEVS